MKIMQVVPCFGIGGAEIMCENLVYELKKHGHEIVVVSLYNTKTAITERLQMSGVDIRYLDKKTGFDFSMFRKLHALFQQENPDIIHSHIYVTKYVFPVAAGLKIKVIHTVHNVAEKENDWFARKVNQFFFKHCHVIPVALSELIQDTLVREYGLHKEQIPVIYNGVELSKCLPKEDYSVMDNFTILHIGRFSEQKNHIGLIKAFHLFHTKHPDSELWLIGDGEKRAEIERYVSQNGLNENVKFLGLQNNVYGYLHDADIFTLPSNYEGIPMTLIEAMGTGLPIVATAVGGVPDMLTNNEDALIVTNEVSAVADSFEKLYNDEIMRASFGARACKRAAAFSAIEMAKGYENAYLK